MIQLEKAERRHPLPLGFCGMQPAARSANPGFQTWSKRIKRLFATAAFALLLASHAFAGEFSAADIARLPQDKVAAIDAHCAQGQQFRDAGILRG